MRRVRWNIVLANLLITALGLTFFSTAPLFGFPAEWDESFALVQGIVPVFLGNIGFAAAFAAQTPAVAEPTIDDERLALVTLLAYGSAAVFVLVSGIACAAYWISNRPGATVTIGQGMSLATLQAVLTGALGVNTAASNHLLARLFPQQDKRLRR